MKRLAAFFTSANRGADENQQFASGANKQARLRQVLSVISENHDLEVSKILKVPIVKDVKMLSVLPIELIFSIFDFLPVRDLVAFSNSSRRASNLVFSYSSNLSVQKRIFPHDLRHKRIPDNLAELHLSTSSPLGPYQDVVEADVDYALLVMVSSRHKTRGERIRIFVNWLAELLCLPQKSTQKSSSKHFCASAGSTCPNASHCVGLYASGAFLYMVTAREQNRTAWLASFYQHLNAKFNLEQMVERALKGKDDFYTRLFILRTFLLPGLCNQDPTWTAFWLDKFLRPLSYFERANLLLLLGAPCDYESGKINSEMVTSLRFAITTGREAESRFKELGDLLKFVHDQKILPDLEFVAMVGYLFSANQDLEDPCLVAFLLNFSGIEVAFSVLRSTLNPVRQLALPNARFSYVCDVLFFMVGVAFLTRQTQKFAEILDLINRLSRETGMNPNFSTNVAFRLGHRLAEQLASPQSEFRQQLLTGGQEAGGLVFIGHLVSILVQRGINSGSG